MTRHTDYGVVPEYRCHSVSCIERSDKIISKHDATRCDKARCDVIMEKHDATVANSKSRCDETQRDATPIGG